MIVSEVDSVIYNEYMNSGSIRDLQKAAHLCSLEHGWYDCKTCNGVGRCDDSPCGDCAGTGVSDRNVPEMIALIHSELSEALEFYRTNNEGHGLSAVFDAGHRDPSGKWLAVVDRKTGVSKPDGMAIELADAVIRIMDLAEYLKIDLAAAIATKHRYNENRPYRHGGKSC